MLALRFNVFLLWAFRVGGILPFGRLPRLLARSYQVVAVLFHLAVVALSLFRLRSWPLASSEAQGVPCLMSDLVIPMGSAAGLLAVGALQGSRRLLKCLGEQECNPDFLEILAKHNGYDGLITLIAWFGFLGVRLGELYALSKMRTSALSAFEISYQVLLIISSSELLLLTLVAQRITRQLACAVDSFCYHFWCDMSYTEAVSQWNMLQASVRHTCSLIEKCFALLLATFGAGCLVLVLDWNATRGVEWFLCSLPILLVFIGKLMVCASNVSEACDRVPQLINATDLNENDLDPDRMYLVDYIAASAAGFYVFDIRVTSGMILRFINSLGLVMVTLARLVQSL